MPGGPGGLGRPPVEMMQPRPGLVFKTRTIPPKGSGEQPRKVFINVVMHELVKKPLNASMEEVGQDHIENAGISNLRVPLDVGEARQVCMPESKLSNSCLARKRDLLTSAYLSAPKPIARVQWLCRSLSLSLHLRLSVSVFLSLSVCLSVYLSICLSVCVSASASFSLPRPPHSLSLLPLVSLPLSLSLTLFPCLSTSLSFSVRRQLWRSCNGRRRDFQPLPGGVGAARCAGPHYHGPAAPPLLPGACLRLWVGG